MALLAPAAAVAQVRPGTVVTPLAANEIKTASAPAGDHRLTGLAAKTALTAAHPTPGKTELAS